MLGVLGEVGFYSKKLSIKWQRAVLSENASLWHRGLLKRPVVPLRYVFCFLLGSGGKSPTVWYVLVVPACYQAELLGQGTAGSQLRYTPVSSVLEPIRARHC